MPQGTFGDDENILHLHCGGRYKIVYFCRNFSHCALKTGDMIKVDFNKSDFPNCYGVRCVVMFPYCWTVDPASEC